MYRVIVVEDSLVLRKGIVCTTNWSTLNCEIIADASNGIEGEALINSLKPDIVITDIRMPGMNGLEMVKKIKDDTNIKFIIITAFNEFEYAKQALKLGAVDYISKPIEDGAIEAAVIKATSLLDEEKEYRKFKEKLEDVEDSKIMLFKEYLSGGNSITEFHVKNITQYISLHFQENIGARDIATSQGVSESHCNRLMKEQTGFTLSDYLQHYRIKKACEYLSDSAVRVYEVADKVGIVDQRYFSVIFKRLVGITPKEFQNRLNNQG